MPKLTGTKKQKLLALYAQGYDIASPEAKKAASNYKTRQAAWKEWQDAGLPGRVGQTIAEADSDTTVETETDTAPPQQRQGSEANADTKPASSGSTTMFLAKPKKPL